MKKILGLDLGVSSIGWALVNEAEKKDEKSSIIRLGVRVNSLTTDEQQDFEKGKSITTNADRTLKRGMRRNLQRYKLRRDNLIDCLKKNGIITNESILCEEGNATTFETYRMRAKAATEEITLEAFARVLLMINKKRGYKSNRKASGNDEGALIDGMSVARELYENNITPGQYVSARLQSNKKYIPEFYTSDLQEEFKKVYEFQKTFYPELLTDELYSELQNKSSKASYAILSKNGINIAENKSKEKKKQAYVWRSEAVNHRLPIEIVAAVLCDINGHINKSNNYLGAIGDRSKELYFNNLTVGQLLMQKLCENPNASLKNIVYYRQDYLDEFERIWETQCKFHPELTPDLKQEIRDIIIFYQRNLKSQKGLIGICEFERREIAIEGKKGKKVVGRRVCPKSSPIFQEFKIWQIINNLVVENCITNEKFEPNIEEKEMLFNELNTKEKLSKKDALKLLFKNYKDFDLNYQEIEGNKTIASLIKACEEIIPITGHNEYNFSKMRSHEIYDAIDRIFSAVGIKSDFLRFNSSAEDIEKEPLFRLWHLLYSYTDDKSKNGNESLVKKISELTNMDSDCARIIANITFKEDYGSLSNKAMCRILPHLKDGNKYSVACMYAGYNHSQRSISADELAQKEYKNRLEQLPHNSLRNPVVEKILNQMINVVNAVACEYGKPDEIRIELARELKSSAKEREEMTKSINEANKKNEEIKKKLQKDFNIAHPSRNDILRYKLYEELKENGYKTLYSNTYISREELFSNKFDIEHIIPQARLFDDSFSNKTLEAQDVNKKKGKETALDYILDNYDESGVEEYKNRVEHLYKKGIIGKTKRDKLLMRGHDIPADFIARDLRDTQYISKKAREILEEMVPHVVPTTGKITERLRQYWQLVDVMQELNWEKYDKQGLTHVIVNREGKEIHRITNWTKRNDHRHHAMDALTIAFTKRGIIQYLNTLNAKEEKLPDDITIIKDKHNKHYFAPPFDNFRSEARKHLENILVSIKSKSKVVTKNTNKTKAGKGENKCVQQLTPRKQLHKETIYGSSQRYVTFEEKVGSSFNEERIAMVANRRIREALLARLAQFNGDAKKAFTGKNSLDKNPLYIDEANSISVPPKVKLVEMETIYTVRKNINKDLSIEKVVDKGIKKILQQRLSEYGGDAAAAFSNLDEKPIWLNKAKGICIKRVAVNDAKNLISLHEKKDHHGNFILDENGNRQPVDFVSTGNNHHVAIYVDTEGNLQEKITSFFDATALAIEGLPVIDKEYNSYLGWKFLFSMKQNEYFVFPNEKTGFNPEDIDLTDERNLSIISPNLYRAQAISSKDYWFRHHLETTVDKNILLKDITWKRITALQNLRGIVKVRVNHIGQIVAVGE